MSGLRVLMSVPGARKFALIVFCGAHRRTRAPQTPADPPIYVAGAPAPDTRNFVSASGLPIIRLIRPIHRDAGRPTKNVDGCGGEGRPPNVNGGVWGGGTCAPPPEHYLCKRSGP